MRVLFLSQVSCGANHVAAVHSSGELYTWGFGSAGRLGHDISGPTSDPRADVNRPTVVRERRGAAWVGSRRDESCCHGCNSVHAGCFNFLFNFFFFFSTPFSLTLAFYLVGYALLPFFSFSWVRPCDFLRTPSLNACIQVRGLLGFPVVGVAAGYAHSAAITADARLFVWGSGATGKLGLGPVTGKEECYCSVPTPIVIGDSVIACAALRVCEWAGFICFHSTMGEDVNCSNLT